ncbi:hypothetical protein BU26DRAFT_561431 [Trematosphaeria pertusa]|uniref:Uncharacterized protein n=1 Tax=Trematosphaeria pertusa TaxID=390896 RepID=A0A6A6IMG8_9PLEO|nr:uncharacterized protein BU26DRAFT_561431 [Trematosphaeria pertusa]KAF2251616.1 hypothetical protein BU26DRAFT_561431 [Trematosphaeria pertusa]
MGLPTTPQDAAPAYDDVVHDHPVNQFPPSGSSSGYAVVPQDDDLEQNAGSHNHTSRGATPAPPQGGSGFSHALTRIFEPKPHTHCEQCDAQQAARERRENERHCCAMVAATFMMAFICTMILGIVVASAMAKARRHMHDD